MAVSLLKQRRQALGHTQAQVAKAIGVSQPTYQNYESGNLPIPEGKVKRLARALKMPVDEITGLARQKEREEFEKGEFPGTQYWGELVAHFGKGPPLIVSIDFEQYSSIFRGLQDPKAQFLSIESRHSNQMIAVRRAAITDIYLSDDGSDTYGPEHESYDLGPFGVYPSDAFWEIADELLSDEAREELNEGYGEEEVTHVARAIGLDMPEDIDRLIEAGNVPTEEREKVLKEAEESLDRARQATKQITWQFSNGKVRREDYSYDNEFLRYWWVRDEVDPDGQGPMIIVEAEDAQTAFINPHAIDYISIPLHKFEQAQREEENNEFGEDDDEEELIASDRPAPNANVKSRKKAAKRSNTSKAKDSRQRR
jgi:transcriptional regulator with XRE-family HTH domain